MPSPIGYTSPSKKLSLYELARLGGEREPRELVLQAIATGVGWEELEEFLDHYPTVGDRHGALIFAHCLLYQRRSLIRGFLNSGVTLGCFQAAMRRVLRDPALRGDTARFARWVLRLVAKDAPHAKALFVEFRDRGRGPRFSAACGQLIKRDYDGDVLYSFGEKVLSRRFPPRAGS